MVVDDVVVFPSGTDITWRVAGVFFDEMDRDAVLVLHSPLAPEDVSVWTLRGFPDIASMDDVDSRCREYAGRLESDDRYDLDGTVPRLGTVLTVPPGSVEKFSVDDASSLWKEQGRCTTCGDRGYWHALVLFCNNGHGRIV